MVPERVMPERVTSIDRLPPTSISIPLNHAVVFLARGRFGSHLLLLILAPTFQSHPGTFADRHWLRFLPVYLEEVLLFCADRLDGPACQGFQPIAVIGQRL